MELNKTLRTVLLVALLICSTFCIAKKQDLNRLITAIATVESELNEKAVSGDCAGYLQIRPTLVKECNEILKKKNSKKRYSLSDRFSKKKSIAMFYLIQEKFNPSHSIERALWVWNAGPYATKRPTEYINKVMKEYRKIR